MEQRHNPYFNRWFSAIYDGRVSKQICPIKSQSLF